jgi:hypothetical protein
MASNTNRRRYFRRFFGLLIVLFILLFFSYRYFIGKDFKNNYQKKYRLIQERKKSLYYLSPFVDYFEENFELPIDFDTILKQYSNTNNVFTDCLSRDSSLIKYLPVYNKNNNKRETLFLISAGVDGKINTDITSNDTIYEGEIEKKLNFYNDSIKEKNNIISKDTNDYYSFIKYFFGNKDYLIHYVDFIEFYKKQAGKIYSLDKIINYIEKNKSISRKRSIGYKAKVPKESLLGNKSNEYLNFKSNGYLIKNKTLNGYKFNINSSDSLMVIGQIKSIDYKNKTISFSNCIQVSTYID